MSGHVTTHIRHLDIHKYDDIINDAVNPLNFVKPSFHEGFWGDGLEVLLIGGFDDSTCTSHYSVY